MDFIKLREKLLNNTAGRLLLAFAAFIYGLGVKFVLLAYKKGWRAQKAVNSRVVCIGNITAGGTGKTTAVLLCASKLSKAGIRTAVVSRGYKRSAKKDEVVVLFDKDLLNGIYFVCMLVPFLSTFLAIIIDVRKSIVNVSKRHSINRLWA